MVGVLFMMCAVTGMCLMFGCMGLAVTLVLEIGAHAIKRRRK